MATVAPVKPGLLSTNPPPRRTKPLRRRQPLPAVQAQAQDSAATASQGSFVNRAADFPLLSTAPANPRNRRASCPEGLAAARGPCPQEAGRGPAMQGQAVTGGTAADSTTPGLSDMLILFLATSRNPEFARISGCLANIADDMYARPGVEWLSQIESFMRQYAQLEQSFKPMVQEHSISAGAQAGVMALSLMMCQAMFAHAKVRDVQTKAAAALRVAPPVMAIPMGVRPMMPMMRPVPEGSPGQPGYPPVAMPAMAPAGAAATPCCAPPAFTAPEPTPRPTPAAPETSAPGTSPEPVTPAGTDAAHDLEPATEPSPEPAEAQEEKCYEISGSKRIDIRDPSTDEVVVPCIWRRSKANRPVVRDPETGEEMIFFDPHRNALVGGAASLDAPAEATVKPRASMFDEDGRGQFALTLISGGSWDWPLSRPEKKERFIMLQQMELVEEVEELRAIVGDECYEDDDESDVESDGKGACGNSE